MLAARNLWLRVSRCAARISALKPRSVRERFHLRTSRSARRSFHVIRLWNSSPVRRSHVVKVDRIVQIPTLRIEPAGSPESSTTLEVRSQAWVASINDFLKTYAIVGTSVPLYPLRPCLQIHATSFASSAFPPIMSLMARKSYMKAA